MWTTSESDGSSRQWLLRSNPSESKCAATEQLAQRSFSKRSNRCLQWKVIEMNSGSMPAAMKFQLMLLISFMSDLCIGQ
jgi:hypothetical protein